MRSQHVGDLTPSTSFPKAAKAKAKQSECIGTWKPTVNKHHITTSSKCHCGTNQSSSNATKMLMMLECHPFCFSARIMPGGHTSSWMSLNHIRSRRLESLEWYPDIRFWRLYTEDAKRVQGTMDWSPSESQRARTCLTILTSASDTWQKWKKSKHTGLDKGRPGSIRLR